jgi:hypothetical protein
VIDANRCLAWVLQQPGSIRPELRAAIGDRIYGCDDCQDACPPTVRLGRRHARALDPAAEAWVDVLALLDADDQTLLDRHGRWYIAGREPRWLRRNALVVLGNTADAGDQRVQEVLARYRHHDDPILAEHATWASRQLGLLTRQLSALPRPVAAGVEPVASARQVSESSSEPRGRPGAEAVEPVAPARQARESSSELGGEQSEPEQ